MHVPQAPLRRNPRAMRLLPSRARRPEANDCLVQGDLEQLGAACDSIPQCVALRVKPGKLHLLACAFEGSLLLSCGVHWSSETPGACKVRMHCLATWRATHAALTPGLPAGWMGLPGPQTIALAKNETSEDSQQLNPNSIVYGAWPAAPSSCLACCRCPVQEALRLPGGAARCWLLPLIVFAWAHAYPFMWGVPINPHQPTNQPTYLCRLPTRTPVNNTRLQLQSGGGSSSAVAVGSQPSSSSSSLSGGAIAGIAVAAAVAVVAAAGGGWVLLRRRQRRQRTVGGEAGSKSGGADGASTAEALSLGSSQPTAQSARSQAWGGASTGAGSTQAAAHAGGASAGSAGYVERAFQLRSPTPVSPFAAMASRAGSSAGGGGSPHPPSASPFAAAARARRATPSSTSPPAGTLGQPSATALPIHSSTERSGGLASLAGIPSASVEAGSSSGVTGSGTTDGSGSTSRMLPELRAHVAEVSPHCWCSPRWARGAAGLQAAA